MRAPDSGTIFPEVAQRLDMTLMAEFYAIKPFFMSNKKKFSGRSNGKNYFDQAFHTDKPRAASDSARNSSRIRNISSVEIDGAV